MPDLRSRLRWGSVVLLAAGLPGCGGADRPTVYPVEGRLSVAGGWPGTPRLAFHPVDGAGLYPVAVTDPDGTFRLTTYAAGDGAPASEYVVTLIWPHEGAAVDECECVDVMTHDRLRGRYADPATSELRAVVGSGPNSITLRATVGVGGWNLPPTRGIGPTDERRRPAGW